MRNNPEKRSPKNSYNNVWHNFMLLRTISKLHVTVFPHHKEACVQNLQMKVRV